MAKLLRLEDQARRPGIPAAIAAETSTQRKNLSSRLNHRNARGPRFRRRRRQRKAVRCA